MRLERHKEAFFVHTLHSADKTWLRRGTFFSSVKRSNNCRLVLSEIGLRQIQSSMSGQVECFGSLAPHRGQLLSISFFKVQYLRSGSLLYLVTIVDDGEVELFQVDAFTKAAVSKGAFGEYGPT